MSESTIRAIDAHSVHRITSGQVVIDLQTAVKELVENSLDAGATSIGGSILRLRDCCPQHPQRSASRIMDSNPSRSSTTGVESRQRIMTASVCRLPFLVVFCIRVTLLTALKHYTSKLSSFEDLSRVFTFGFRGEALSSLCALTDGFSVITATAAEAPMGTFLDMDRNGKVRSKSKIARQVCHPVVRPVLFTYPLNCREGLRLPSQTYSSHSLCAAKSLRGIRSANFKKR